METSSVRVCVVKPSGLSAEELTSNTAKLMSELMAENHAVAALRKILHRRVNYTHSTEKSVLVA